MVPRLNIMSMERWNRRREEKYYLFKESNVTVLTMITPKQLTAIIRKTKV
jgi:hypothetical protein